MTDRPSFFFDDLRVGQRFVSGSHALDEAEIIRFAREFDPQPFHVDVEAARHSVFQGLVASGWHTAAVTMRLLIEGEARIAGGHVGLGGEAKWPNPTRPGDILQVHTEVIELTPSQSRPDRGVVTLRSETHNQRAEVLLVLISKLLVPRRP